MKTRIQNWLIGLFLMPFMIGTAAAGTIDIDMTNSAAAPVPSNPVQVRVDDLKAQYFDPRTGQLVEAVLDVIFQWNSETFVLAPVALAGCSNGQLRVQVSCSVTGHPLVNGAVNVGDQYVMTDQDGIARFSGLPDTTLIVRVSADGYDEESVQVDIPCGGWKRMAVGLMPLAQ